MRSCSTRSWRAATRSSSSGRPTTGRCCRCATAARTCGWSSSNTTGSTSPRSTGCCARALEPTLAHIIPNFQNPAGYTLSAEKRARLIELARDHALHDLRGRPVRCAAVHGEHAADDAVDGSRERRIRVVVLEDGVSRHPCRLPRRPRGPDRADRQARDLHVHLAEHGRPGDRPRVLRARARSTARSRPSRTALRERADTLCDALERELPDARFVRPTVATSCGSTFREGTDVGALSEAAAARDVQFVKGTRLRARGRRVVAAARLLGRHAGARSRRASSGSPRPTPR